MDHELTPKELVFNAGSYLLMLGIVGVPVGLLVRALADADWVMIIPLGFALLGGLMAAAGHGAPERQARRVAAALGLQHAYKGQVSSLVPTGAPGTPGTRDLRSQVIWGGWHGAHVQVFAWGKHFYIQAIQLPAPLPPMRLYPRNARWNDVERGHDLTLESPEFNERWRVQGHDIEAAHHVLAPHLMARLLEPEVDDAALIIEGDCLYAVVPRESQTVDDLRRRLDLLHNLCITIPGFVWRMHGGLGAAPSPEPSTQHRGVVTLEQAVDKEIELGAEDLMLSGVTPAPERTVQQVIDAHEIHRDVGAFQRRGRDRNGRGRLSVLLAFTLVFAPVGVLMGFLGVQAYREGRAANLRTSVWGIVLSTGATMLLALVIAVSLLSP